MSEAMDRRSTGRFAESRQEPGAKTPAATPKSATLSSWVVGILILVATGIVGSPAWSQSTTYTASLQGTLGGPLNADDPDPGLGNLGYQLGFSWVVQPKVNVLARLGEVQFSGEQLDSLVEPSLRYATIGGEYTYEEGYYRSGLYLGLGVYNLEGTRGSQTVDSTSLGAVLGVTGDFPITRRLSFVADLSGHVTLNDSRVYVFFHAGLAVHF